MLTEHECQIFKKTVKTLITFLIIFKLTHCSIKSKACIQQTVYSVKKNLLAVSLVVDTVTPKARDYCVSFPRMLSAH